MPALGPGILSDIFSDRREIEIDNILKEWDNGILTLRQTITALSEYTSVIDLNEYDFTINKDLWDYRQINGYYDLLNEFDIAELDKIESDINDVKSEQNGVFV